LPQGRIEVLRFGFGLFAKCRRLIMARDAVTIRQRRAIADCEIAAIFALGHI
jgi:hypothetical protein